MSVVAPERRSDRGLPAPGRPIPRPPARPDLAPVGPEPRRAGRRRGRSPAGPALVGLAMVLAALLALAVMHALLIGGQLRLDDLNRSVAAETEAVRRLELQVAQLESPERVLEAARTRLGMVTPPEVGYLQPLGTGDEGVATIRVAPAVPEPEPEPEPEPQPGPGEQTDGRASAEAGDGSPDGSGSSDGDRSTTPPDVDQSELDG